jgi:hypothetical protein
VGGASQRERTIRYVGSDGWLLVRDDGISLTSLQLLDTHADAEAALAAKRFTAMCFIGRNNNRADHVDWVLRATQGSEFCLGSISRGRLLPDHRAKASGRLLARADGAMFEWLDNKAEAEAALAVAKRFRPICYIDRHNKRASHEAFVMNVLEVANLSLQPFPTASLFFRADAVRIRGSCL